MVNNMPVWFHAKSQFDVGSSRSKPKQFVKSSSGNPGGLRWNKNCGSSADIGGSASGMGCRSTRSDASKLELVDAQGERERAGVPEAGEETWATSSADRTSSARVGGTTGKIARGFSV